VLLKGISTSKSHYQAGIRLVEGVSKLVQSVEIGILVSGRPILNPLKTKRRLL